MLKLSDNDVRIEDLRRRHKHERISFLRNIDNLLLNGFK